MRPERLSLRPGEWGDRSQKVSVLAAGDSWLVLEQPFPFGFESAEPFASTELLQVSLRDRIQENRPSVQSLGFDGATHIYSLPCSGPVVFAGSRERLAALREDYGSAHWIFRFLILARGGPSDESITCDLPVAIHSKEKRSLISHTTGKRAKTCFRRLIDGGNLQLWEATTNFLRPDQIRLHASEMGIRIAGETLYGQHEGLSRPDLPGTRRPGGRAFVLLPGPAVHLAELRVPFLCHSAFRSMPPKSFLKWIESQISGEKDLQGILNSLS